MDGGHGAREHLTVFALGCLWYIYDLDVLAEAENEGLYSKRSNVEKVNGQASRSINGTPVMMQCPSLHHLLGPEQATAAREACRRRRELLKRSRSRGRGHRSAETVPANTTQF